MQLWKLTTDNCICLKYITAVLEIGANRLLTLLDLIVVQNVYSYLCLTLYLPFTRPFVQPCTVSTMNAILGILLALLYTYCRVISML